MGGGGKCCCGIRVVNGITIDGVTIPLADITQFGGAALNTIALGISKNLTAQEIADSLAPAAVPIIELIANAIAPGSGTIIEIIAALLSRAQPWTPQQENAWMDREGIGTQS